jgi:hypothetical protein
MREDGVVVMEDKPVSMVRTDSFAQLLEGPGGSWMRGHVKVNRPARSMFHNHQYVKQPESRARDDAEVAGDDGRRVILQKGGPSLVAAPVTGRSGWYLGKYLRIVRGDTRRPSFSSNSFAMRSSPHEGFSSAILRIRTWSSGGIGGRPARHFLRQKNRKPWRCQAIKVPGVTTVNALRQSNRWLSHSRLSALDVRFGGA